MGRVTQEKQSIKAKITNLMVADLIKAELIKTSQEAGGAVQIRG